MQINEYSVTLYIYIYMPNKVIYRRKEKWDEDE